MELMGSRVLVTGASKGIGEAVAREFAARGAHVAVAARSGEVIEALATELGGHGYTVDLADAAQVDGFISRVEADGPVDVLVNNAGMEVFEALENIEPRTIDQLLALNLATPLKLTSQVVPGMVERGSGHIVQVSSLAAIVPVPGSALYGASKAGLTHATACLELELRGTGIGLTTAHLGYVETEMGDRAASAPIVQPILDRLKPFGITSFTELSTVATAIVRAVEKDRRFVLYPKVAMVSAGLSNAPRRLINGLSAGLKFRSPPLASGR